MSVPSITIRIDFGESGTATGTLSVQGSAPTPMDLGGAGLAGAADQGGPPSPSEGFTLSAGGGEPPTPLTGGPAGLSATFEAAPAPASDIAKLASAGGEAGEPPKPDLGPAAGGAMKAAKKAAKKATGKR